MRDANERGSASMSVNVGVDVSKAVLDVHVLESKEQSQFEALVFAGAEQLP